MDTNTKERKIDRMTVGDITAELERIAKVMNSIFEAASEEVSHCSKKEKPSAETARRLANAHGRKEVCVWALDEIYQTFGIEA